MIYIQIEYNFKSNNCYTSFWYLKALDCNFFWLLKPMKEKNVNVFSIEDIQWNLSNPTFSWREILCQNRHRVSYYNV